MTARERCCERDRTQQGELEKEKGSERKSATEEECERVKERDGGSKRNEETRSE